VEPIIGAADYWVCLGGFYEGCVLWRDDVSINHPQVSTVASHEGLTHVIPCFSNAKTR